MEQGGLMDRIYRFQRYFYDATRRFILAGRDRLLDEMDIHPGDRVVEAGCGTARNLIRLSRMYPDAQLYGLDISRQMLKTARKKIRRSGLETRIELKECPAEEMHYSDTFGLETPFDHAFFSYSLSMIPACVQAFDAAVGSVKTGGMIHVVDFWDLEGLPEPVRRLLAAWLSLFHVEHKPELLKHMEQIGTKDGNRYIVKPLFRRYAYLASFRKSP